MNRRIFSSTLLLSTTAAGPLLAATSAHAQSAAPVEGRDYTLIQPAQPAGTGGKVEVLEFFSYACPHCAAFEPSLEAWARGLPADVVLNRVPVPFLYNAENFQRTYYALENLGLVDKVQPKIFTAVHVDKQRLDKSEDIAAIVAKNGGDAAKFIAAFKSFSVAASVAKARKLTADYKIDGVPSLAVQGKYLTSPSQAGGAPQALGVANALIQRAKKS